MEQSPVGHRPAGLFIAAFLMHCYGAGDYGCFIEEKVGFVKFPSYDKTFIIALAGEENKPSALTDRLGDS